MRAICCETSSKNCKPAFDLSRSEWPAACRGGGGGYICQCHCFALPTELQRTINKHQNSSLLLEQIVPVWFTETNLIMIGNNSLLFLLTKDSMPSICKTNGTWDWPQRNLRCGRAASALGPFQPVITPRGGGSLCSGMNVTREEIWNEIDVITEEGKKEFPLHNSENN